MKKFALILSLIVLFGCTRSKDLSFKNIGNKDIIHCELNFEKVSYGGKYLFVGKGTHAGYSDITKLSNEGIIKWKYDGDGKLYQQKVSLKDMPKLFRGKIVFEINNDSVEVKYTGRYE